MIQTPLRNDTEDAHSNYFCLISKDFPKGVAPKRGGIHVTCQLLPRAGDVVLYCLSALVRHGCEGAHPTQHIKEKVNVPQGCA